MNKLIIAILLLILPVFVNGEPGQEKGYPFLKNFTTAEYRAHAQNFAVVSDRYGMTYFGNFAGVLQNDGETWRLIPTEKTTKVSALAIDSAGKVYVGARGEIGFLGPGAGGKMEFISLLKNEPGKYPAFDEIIQIFAAGDRIYFISRNLIFILEKGNPAVWTAPHEIMGAFYIQDILYLQLKETGLVRYDQGKLTGISGSEGFTGAIEIRAILSYPGNRKLVVTDTQGLFLLDSLSLKEFDAPVNDWLMKNPVTCGIGLPDGTFAIGTSRSGIIIISSEGKIQQIIDKAASLQNSFVQSLYAANNSILWAALNDGISLIEIPSPLTYFDEKSGVEGAVSKIFRFQQTLYASTYQGLFYYDESSFGFVPVREIISSCWDVAVFDDYFLTATSQGVYMVKDKKATLISEGFALSLTGSPKDPSVVYVGETKGFYSLKREGNNRYFRKYEGFDAEVNDLASDDSGNIWGATMTKGIFRYMPGDTGLVFYGKQNGLPDDAGISVNPIHGKMSVSTRKGIYLYNGQTQSLDSTRLITNVDPASAEWFSLIIPSADGNLWVTGGDETHVRLLVKKDGGYQPVEEPFLPVSDDVIWTIFPDVNGITWFGGPDGLIRYNSLIRNGNTEPYPTLIRKMIIRNDSVLFSGNIPGVQADISEQKLLLKYSSNSLHFDFSLPFYTPGGNNLYQFYLEGFDDTWNAWSIQSNKEYTNIPRGKYVFHVRAKNVYGKIASEATVNFQVLSPWYATLWAYLLYLAFLSGLVYFIVILRNRKLLKEKRILEQRIADRTAEVVQQKEEIESQSQELADKNDELEKINSAIKSINAEINFENLLQSLLEKMKIIRRAERSLALVYDKERNGFRFKASYGWDLAQFEPVTLSLAEAENRYLRDSEEVFEDIFIKSDFSAFGEMKLLPNLTKPKSMMILVIRIENRIDAFLIFENRSKEHAFESKDISLVRNSKEHIISAFIRTRILEDLQKTLQNLKDTQDQLVQSEKLASLGQLTAGIAHEIQNPLNFVNNFSSLSADLADELSETLEEIKDSVSEDKYASLEEVTEMIRANVKRINEHGKRAESIVKGMLQHSRGKTGEYEEVDINNMVREYVNLAYHGMKAKDKSFSTEIRTRLDPAVGKASIIPQDLSRVVLNIVNNACYALDEKAKRNLQGFKPEVVVSTSKLNDKIEIRIRDNGTGIPDHVIEKIFDPFFTTKPTGKGTGLGLSMSFDIVNKIHKGKLEVKSKEGEYTEFIITIPEKQS